MSTHEPPQAVKPDVHEPVTSPEASPPVVPSMPGPASVPIEIIVQRPLWQLYPMGHALPQPPQLSGCVAMSTQRSRQ